MLIALKRAARAIRRDPLLSCAAVLCLALGIGANTALFTVVSGLLARNIPAVEEPDRLVAIRRTHRASCCSENSYPVFEAIRTETAVFESVESHYPLLSVSLDGSRVWGQVVSPEYFETLKPKLILGRGFSPDDNGVAVVSYALWQGRFASSPEIVGRKVSLNNGSFTIVGVASRGFRGPDLGIGADLWVPMSAVDRVMPEHPSLADRAAPWLLTYGRLRPGISLDQAQARLDLKARQLERDYPDSDKDRGFLVEPASAFHPSYRRSVVNVAMIAGGLVGLVLIVACVNVVSILLARVNQERKQIAIRVALGAGPGRILGEMVLHSTALALSGGSLGVLLSYAVLRVGTSLHLPVSLPIELGFQIDWRVLAFTAFLSLATGTLVGTVTALRASRPDLVAALGNAPWSGRRSRWDLRDALICMQVSVTVVLLVVTFLFLRSLVSASTVDPGFRTANVLLLDFDPRIAGHAATVSERIRGDIEDLPGVQSATFTDVVPLGLGARAANLRTGSESLPLRADVFQVGPRYFETLGIRMLQGRGFHIGGEAGEAVAIVNSLAASTLWPGADPIGRSVQRGSRSYRIIGVVSGVKSRSVGEPARPCLYLPLLGTSSTDPTPFGVTLAIQTVGNPGSVAASVRERILQLEPAIGISNVRTMQEHIETALVFPRAGALVAGAFGVLATLLTAIGIYGVVSHSVGGRTREFGIRLAIGAPRSHILHAAAARGGLACFAGLCLGLTAAYAGTRLLRTVLYGVAPDDPVSFIAALALVATTTLVACYLPARRIARLDPLRALKVD